MNKFIHTFVIFVVRILPMIYSLVVILFYFSDYFDIKVPYIFDTIFGVNFLELILLWILSKVYKFCIYHRMFIYYLLLNKLLFAYDSTYGFPLSDIGLFRMLLFISGVFLFLTLWLYKKYGDREHNCKRNKI